MRYLDSNNRAGRYPIRDAYQAPHLPEQVALASAATEAAAQPWPRPRGRERRPPPPDIAFPRVFTGRHLTAMAFPLGGVRAGSISLGGRGQLRDWEIAYAFPAIWGWAHCSTGWNRGSASCT